MFKEILNSVKRQIRYSISKEINQTVDDAIEGASDSIKKAVTQKPKKEEPSKNEEPSKKEESLKAEEVETIEMDDVGIQQQSQPTNIFSSNQTVNDDGSVLGGMQKVGAAVHNFEAVQGNMAADVLKAIGGMDEQGNLKEIKDVTPEQDLAMTKAFFEFSKSDKMKDIMGNFQTKASDLEDAVLDSVERVATEIEKKE